MPTVHRTRSLPAAKRPAARATTAKPAVRRDRQRSVQPWLKPGLMVAAMVLAWFGQEQFFDKHLSAGLILWLAAAVAAVIAFAGQKERVAYPQLTPKREALLLGFIVLVAAAFRFYRLGEMPHGYFFDEAVNALEGLAIMNDPKYLPIFGPPDAPLPALHFYLNVVAQTLGGVSVLATKFVPAVWGLVTVVMAYFLARRLVSTPVALAAALLLAVMRWHVNFSRINFVGISTPLFGAAAMYFLLRGLETKNRWHMALSGLAVSLGLYTYYASNLVPMVIGPYLALQLLWERDFLKTQWKNLLAFLAVSILVFAPLGIFALSEPDRFFVRNGQVLIFNHVPPSQAVSAFWSNVKTTFLMFNYFGDCNGRHNIPEVPMLDIFTGLLFGLGLIWSLTQLKNRRVLLILFWFVAALVPGFLTIEAPQGYRCIGAIIPVTLLAALGLERLWQGLLDITSGLPLKQWLWVALVVLVAAAGAQNASDYFERQATAQACWSEFSCREFAMGEKIHELGPNYHTYISAGSFAYPTIRYVGYPYVDAEPFQLVQSIPSHFSGNKNEAYLLLPIHDGALELLRYYYPQGKQTVHGSPYEFTLYTEYQVSHAQVLAQRGLIGEYQDSAGRHVTRRDGAETFTLSQPGAGLTGAVSATWTGSIRLAVWGVHNLRLNGADWSRIRVDGQALSAGGRELSQGVHTLEIQAGFHNTQPELALQIQRGEHGPWNGVEGYALSPLSAVHGLTGTYFATANWTGKPYLRRVDPLLAMLGADFPLSAPFSVRWEGSVKAPVAGAYTFGIQCNESAWLSVDGRPVMENTAADTYREGTVVLSAGRHRIHIDYQKKEGAYPQLVLYWTTPGRGKEKVPFAALGPGQGEGE